MSKRTTRKKRPAKKRPSHQDRAIATLSRTLHSLERSVEEAATRTALRISGLDNRVQLGEVGCGKLISNLRTTDNLIDTIDHGLRKLEERVEILEARKLEDGWVVVKGIEERLAMIENWGKHVDESIQQIGGDKSDTASPATRESFGDMLKAPSIDPKSVALECGPAHGQKTCATTNGRDGYFLAKVEAGAVYLVNRIEPL